MNDLNLGSIKIPINAATKSFAILAKRGAGKTYLGGVMAEELFKNNIPFVVFDPIDVWWGLRLAANGKDKGLPIVVFGLEHADILLDRDMGRSIAEAIVRENISCVISTFGMPKTAARYLIAEFAETLLNINNTPRHVFIEEAHEYVPQRIVGGMSNVFSRVEALVTMGRNRGIGVTMLNQRAATINKDVLTQIDTLLALRSVGPQDRKAIADWVEEHEAEGDFDKFINSLSSLPTGEGWIWSPEFLGIFEKFEIRKRETFHPDREKIGSKFVMPQLDQIDVQSFINKFKTTATPKAKKGTKPETKDTADKTSLASVSQVPVVDRQEVQNIRNQYESQLIVKDGEIRRLNGIIENVRRAVGNETSFGPAFPAAIEGKNAVLVDSLPGYEKAIMAAITPHPNIPFSRSQLAIKSGKSYTSSTYSQAISKLLKLQLLHSVGKDLIYKN